MAGLRNTPWVEMACWGSLELVAGAEYEEFGRVEGLGRVERPGQARAGLRGDAGPVVFEKDPGSVACPGFIPPTVVPEAMKVHRLRMEGPSQFPPF